MNRFYKSKPFKAFLIVIAALLAGAIIATITHTGKSPISSVLGTITQPLQRASTYVGDSISEFCDFFRSSDTLQKENAQLKQKIVDYQAELIEYEDAKRTLEIYEEFLGVKEEHPDFEFVSAGVLSRDTTDVYGSFILDKGSSKGVEVNDPVIYGKSLVGIVSSVSLTNCTVKIISNPELNAAVYETRSNEIGYITGFEDGIKENSCKIPGLSKDSNIAAGGVVCTTGIGGVFPRDLIIGTVTQINKSKTDISYYAEVESSVDFSRLTDVFIITHFDGQGINQ